MKRVMCRKPIPTMGRLLFCCLVIANVGFGQRAHRALSDLSWLGGCWEGHVASGAYSEHWLKPSENMMLGIGRTVIKNEVREYEYLRILRHDDGHLYYVAFPSGQQETWFKLSVWRDREVEFSNPEHDFPQRILYRLLDDGSLLVRAVGVIKGEERTKDFPLKRAACE